MMRFVGFEKIAQSHENTRL